MRFHVRVNEMSGRLIRRKFLTPACQKETMPTLIILTVILALSHEGLCNELCQPLAKMAK